MKKLNVLISIISLSIITPCCFAYPQFTSDPYLGLEAIQTNQHYKAGYGKNVFQTDMINYAGFAGFKFTRNFGFELGYEVQPKKTKNVVLTAGQSLPGLLKLTGTDTKGAQTSIESWHQYLGLFAEFKDSLFKVKLKFQLLVGASRTTVEASTNHSYTNGAPITPIIRTFSKTKIVPMIKFSGMHNFSDNFGIRASVNYRHMLMFNVRSHQTSINSRIKLKDAFGLGLGVVYVFK